MLDNKWKGNNGKQKKKKKKTERKERKATGPQLAVREDNGLRFVDRVICHLMRSIQTGVEVINGIKVTMKYDEVMALVMLDQYL